MTIKRPVNKRVQNTLWQDIFWLKQTFPVCGKATGKNQNNSSYLMFV